MSKDIKIFRAWIPATENKKNRRGRKPEGLRPRRLTLQLAPRQNRVALHIVIRRLLSIIQPGMGNTRALVSIVRLSTASNASSGGRPQPPVRPVQRTSRCLPRIGDLRLRLTATLAVDYIAQRRPFQPRQFVEEYRPVVTRLQQHQHQRCGVAVKFKGKH